MRWASPAFMAALLAVGKFDHMCPVADHAPDQGSAFVMATVADEEDLGPVGTDRCKQRRDGCSRIAASLWTGTRTLYSAVSVTRPFASTASTAASVDPRPRDSWSTLDAAPATLHRRRLIRLAFLALDLQRQILEGRQLRRRTSQP